MQTVIFVAFVAALGFAVSRGALDYMANEVTLTIEPNRTVVDFNSSDAPEIQLHVKLKNNTADPVTLDAASPCKILQWVVLSEGHEFVEARSGRETECQDQPIHKKLEPGQELEEFYVLRLTADRFTTAGKYEAHVRYWGLKTLINFSVVPKKV
jgi:hypothetical protein